MANYENVPSETALGVIDLVETFAPLCVVK